MKIPKDWKPDTLYILGDNLPHNHPARTKVKGMTLWKSIDYAPTPSNGLCIRGVWKRENGFRPPKKDEWYLSGCEGFVRAYRAPNDFSESFFVASIVLVKNKTIQTSEIIERY